MLKEELLEKINALPDGTIILFQVVAKEQPNAWQMEGNVSEVLDHIKWDAPAAAITLSHPSLLKLNPLTWENDDE